ncbi:MAG: hypothetical protein ACK4VN_00825 [Bacteroidales bacterium]
MKKNVLLLVSFICFYACNKDGVSICEEKEQKENPLLEILKNDVYLEFPTDELFFAVLENDVHEDFEELILSKSQSEGFVSFAQAYDEFVNKVNCEEISEQEFYALLVEYQDILIIDDDRIVPRIDHPLVNRFISRNGLVKIGNELAIYTEYEKIVATDGDINTLIKAISSNVETENVYRFRYRLQEIQLKSSYCGSFQQDRFTNSRDDRRAMITSRIVMEYHKRAGYTYCSNQNGGDFRTYAETIGYPERRHWLTSNWVNYKTINTLDLNYQARAYSGPLHNVIVFRQNSNAASSITHTHLLHQGQGCWSQQGDFQGEFLRIVANKYKTDGINPNWVILNCGVY